MKKYLKVFCVINIAIFKLTMSDRSEYSVHNRILYKEHYKLSYYDRNGFLRSANFSMSKYNIESIKSYLMERLLNRTMCWECGDRFKSDSHFYKRCKLFICEKKDIDDGCNKCRKRFACLTAGRVEEI